MKTSAEKVKTLPIGDFGTLGSADLLGTVNLYCLRGIVLSMHTLLRTIGLPGKSAATLCLKRPPLKDYYNVFLAFG